MVLKFVAVASILVAGFGGVSIPLVGKSRRFLRPDGDVFAAAKAFAAGVILATGFVHMLRDSWDALREPCLGTHSRAWAKFPFTGFFAMVSALFTLLVDFLATEYYERREARGRVERGKVVDYDEGCDEALLETGIVEVKDLGRRNFLQSVFTTYRSYNRDLIECMTTTENNNTISWRSNKPVFKDIINLVKYISYITTRDSLF